MITDAFVKLALAGALAGLIAPGCASPTPSVASAPAPPRQDIFGENPLAVDPDKANKPLSQILPEVHPPQSVPRDPSPLPERAERALRRAAERRADRRLTEATIELEKALRYAPGRPEIHRALALVLWDAGNTDRARAQIDKALAGGKDDLVCHYLLGRLAARRFDNVEAIEELRRALLCTTTPETEAFKTLSRYQLAEALAAEGYSRAAIDAYLKFLKEYDQLDLGATALPERAALRAAAEGVQENVSRAFAELGEYDSAAQHLALAYADQPMPAATRVLYAKTLARAGHLEAAAQEARAALAEDESAITVLTAIRQAQGRPAAVLDDLRQACDEHPQNSVLVTTFVDALMRRQRGAEAREILEARLKAQPEQDALRWRLFDLLAAQGAWSDALDWAADAVRTRPETAPDATAKITSLADNHEAYSTILSTPSTSERKPTTDFARAYLRGMLADAHGNEAAAAQALSAAIKAAPTFIPARVALARIDVRGARWKDVIAIVRPDTPLPADTRLELLLGLAYRGLDQLDAAETHFSSAIRLNRSNTEAMLALAELFQDAGKPNRAVRQLEALVRADPLNEKAREMLFDSSLRDGDPRAAGEQLAELRRIKAAPTRIARCVARLEFDIDRPHAEAQYRKTLRDAMDAFRPDAETLRLIAGSFQREQRYAAASARLEEALKLDPVNLRAAVQLERCFRLDLRFERALKTTRFLLSRRPNKLQWKGETLDLLMVLQRFDEAARYAQQVLAEPDLEPGTINALQSMLVQIHQLQGDDAQAIATLEAWSQREPDDVNVYHLLLAATQKAGQHDRAMALLRAWPEKFPRGFAAVSMGDIWAALEPGQVDEALQLVLTQIESDPDNGGLQITLIDLLRGAKRFDEAIDLARNSVASSREAGFYQLELLRTYEAAGRFDDAVTLLTKMLGEAGSERTVSIFAPVQLHLELSQVLILSGQYRKALEKINRWLEGAGTNEERLLYLRMLVAAQQEAGNNEEVIQTLTLALELAPDDVGLHNDLGYTLADLGQDLERAEKLVRYAVAREPRNSAYLDSLGWVLYKRGHFAGARTWLTRARYAGEGEDPVVCDHLADACWRRGDRDAARKWWNESLTFAAQRLDTPAPRALDQQTQDMVRAKLKAVQAGEEPATAPVISPAATEEPPVRVDEKKVLE